MGMATSGAFLVARSELRTRTAPLLEAIALRHQIAVLEHGRTHRPCFLVCFSCSGSQSPKPPCLEYQRKVSRASSVPSFGAPFHRFFVIRDSRLLPAGVNQASEVICSGRGWTIRPR